MAVHGRGRRLIILNLYNPNKSILAAEFEHYFNQLGEYRIIVGDFNAHNNIWDTVSIENSTGNSLADVMLADPSLCLLTPANLPTYYHVNTRRFSTLDLCFVGVDLYPQSAVTLGKDLGSDHAPVYTELNFSAVITPFKRRSRWIFGDEQSWKNWSNRLPDREDNCLTLEQRYDLILSNIIQTSRDVFKRTKEIVFPKYSKPWWNALCDEAVGNRHHRKNIFHKHPTVENLIELRRAEAIAKRVCKVVKKDSFISFSGTLNKDTPPHRVWNYVGKLSNKTKSFHAQPIVYNDSIVTNSREKANAIASYYEKTFNSHTHSLDSTNLLLPVAYALANDSETNYNCPFTVGEMERALATLKLTSPGHDDLHNAMLIHLPYNYQIWALDIINESFTNSSIPSQWKAAIILPIPKPGKPPGEPASFRPISLLPCFGKLAEKLICNRLNFVIEAENAFSPTQGGFRRRMCTMDQVARLENVIRNSLGTRQYCVAIFFDLSHAYDGVWHLGLQSELTRCGIKGKLLRWIKEFLTDRTYKVYYEGEHSNSLSISSGVPQGSILAPTLFNIMMSNIPHVQHVNVAEYADDIVVYCSDIDYGRVTYLIQLQVTILNKWLKEWGFKLNEQKTKGMVFSLRPYDEPNINIEGTPITFVNNYKYLGMNLDQPRLSWAGHIKSLIERCLPRVNILRAVSNHHWGADRVTLLQLYKSLIRSIMDYGSIFYMSASKTNLDKLNKIQNICLRTAIGARKTSPIISLEVESNISPLHFQRVSLLAKYYFRLCELPRTLPVTNELFNMNINSYYNSWSSTVRTPPLIVRCWSCLMSCQFPHAEPYYTALCSPVPPWLDMNRYLMPTFAPASVKSLTDEMCSFIFKDLQSSNYSSYLEIYTDGSVFSDDPSTSAAMVVVYPETTISKNWKLSPLMSILSAELYAIREALKYVRTNVCNVHGVVVYSDSQSGIYLLQNTRPKTNIHYVFEIQSLMLYLNSRFPVIIQYIPGHKNIEGNEQADLAAKAGHNLLDTMDAPICKGDRIRLYKRIQKSEWYSWWINEMQLSGKGLHLFKVKKQLSYWGWSSHKERPVETALAKLRIGHVGVRKHLCRFKLFDTERCDCGEVDSVEHFLLQCPKYVVSRTEIFLQLQQMNVPMTLRNILGGGNYPPQTQKSILKETIKYLKDTERIWEL